MKVSVIIPALDEEGAIGGVVEDLRAVQVDHSSQVSEIVVVDNGSVDATAQRASDAGATVVVERERGYGAACLRAIEYLSASPPDVVAFVDGDGSNYADELPALLMPIGAGEADLVVGSRVRRAEPGSLTPAQRFGNALATRIMNRVYGASFTDLGPFRALTWGCLTDLRMEDRNYGWTVEMQLKAVKHGWRCAEVDVGNRSRVAGRSKVAGTLRGVTGAGTKILWTLARYR